LTAIRDQLEHSDTFRLNVDHTFTPTLILHAGIGEQHFYNPDSSPASVLGFDAVANSELPARRGWYAAHLRPQRFIRGHVPGHRTTNGNHYTTENYGGFESDLVHGSHTYKAGGQFRLDAFSNVQVVGNGSNATGSYTSAITKPDYPIYSPQTSEAERSAIRTPASCWEAPTAPASAMFPIHNGADTPLRCSSRTRGRYPESSLSTTDCAGIGELWA